MILFLDFDGVLHPDPCFDRARLFENAPRLQAALAPYPEVAIVLSTSWRLQRALAELTAPLPASLRERVLGVTPLFDPGRTPAALVPYRRQAECVQWLQANGQADSPWLSVDDRASFFTPYCEQLILCPSTQGFTEASAARLDGALRRARARLGRKLDAAL